MSFFIFWLLPSGGDAGLHKVSLSTEDHSALYDTTWNFNTRFYDGGVYLVLDGSRSDQEGMCIYRWTEREFAKLFCTTPREGIYQARAAAVTPSGEELFFSDYLAGIIYRYEPGGNFKRFGVKPNTQDLVVYQGNLIRGNKDPWHNLELVASGEMPSLEKISTALPDDAYHPSEEFNNANEMLLALSGNHLAVGYKLYQKALIFDMQSGNLLRELPFSPPFRGYLSPPADFKVKKGPKWYQEFLEWSDSFHTLMLLAWHRDGLYGLFRQTVDGYGVWARLDAGPDSSYVWDNNNNEEQILAVGPDRIVMGTVSESADGVVTWELWQTSSLP